MRKVLVKKWIPGEINPSAPFWDPYYRNTNCYKEEFTEEGFFQEWVKLNNKLRAIIEFPDGTISEVLSTNFKFIE